ncbi:helicase DnaB [Paenibacillus sp. IB182496]|uniref:Helicase DnaB n=1 Tax=Paenibacillus sabuli TaxID=2772509 RepID=A0A927GRJ4_9BACL|nr:helicase DnaB [Paenibacillus sabuli]MBD2845714.1 helicase DnaB [Paenibacillus sabuli]
MRIANMHQFTEHHRFYMYRNFALSVLDRKTLQLIYQPMVGAGAAAFYELLYHQVEEGRVGYSAIEPARRLLIGLGMELHEQARRELIAHASRLEAVGLLQTSRLVLPGESDAIYEFELAAPLHPDEFFTNQHLALYLRDRIGKFAVLAARDAFVAREPDDLALAELPRDNISTPFYELFRLNAQVVDEELDQALAEAAPTRAAPSAAVPEEAVIHYGELILRFPRQAANRPHVERLRGDERRLAELNYVAYKYGLGVVDICRLLDEDGIFAPSGELQLEALQHKASLLYQQDRKRTGERQRMLHRSEQARQSGEDSGDPPQEHEVREADRLPVPAQLAGRCDVAQYNMLMRNEPHTRFLQRFFPGAVPEWIDRMMERIDVNYRLPDPVINVLVHYILGGEQTQRVSKAFVEAVASNMLVKQVDSFEKAVHYVRQQAQQEEKKQRRGADGESGAASAGAGGRAWNRGGRRKPSLPIIEDVPSGGEMSAEELEEIRRLARRLDGKG